MERYNILETPCLLVSDVHEVKDHLKNLVVAEVGGYSTAINAEKILLYLQDKEMREVIDNSILPIPDGSGAVLGFKFLFQKKCVRLDLPRTVLELASQNKFRVFLYGSSEETNKKAAKVLKEKFPGIQLVGRLNGYIKNEDQVVDEIMKKDPQIVLVALGSPKQEKFAARATKVLGSILFIGCGGALDILAGKVKRAPEIFQNNHLEWFYRLVNEPKRIKRQSRLPLFMIKLIRGAVINRIKG